MSLKTYWCIFLAFIYTATADRNARAGLVSKIVAADVYRQEVLSSFTGVLVGYGKYRHSSMQVLHNIPFYNIGQMFNMFHLFLNQTNSYTQIPEKRMAQYTLCDTLLYHILRVRPNRQKEIVKYLWPNVSQDAADVSKLDEPVTVTLPQMEKNCYYVYNDKIIREILVTFYYALIREFYGSYESTAQLTQELHALSEYEFNAPANKSALCLNLENPALPPYMVNMLFQLLNNTTNIVTIMNYDTYMQTIASLGLTKQLKFETFDISDYLVKQDNTYFLV